MTCMLFLSYITGTRTAQMESIIRLQRQLYVCSNLDARSVSSYPYNWSHILQYVKYVKYTKWIKIANEIAKVRDK